MSPTVGEIVRAIKDRFPPERAEGWDRVGLLAGDPDAEVAGVLLALDAGLREVTAAIEAGANVLVTHHPAFLEPPRTLAPGPGPAGVVYAAVTAGVALVNAHTNLDRDAEAQRLLPRALGLKPAGPLERAAAPMALVTAFVPPEATEYVTSAMAAAGAGRIGDYTECSFTAQGTGAFTAGRATNPTAGAPGERSRAAEARVEMVCPPARANTVVAAAVGAHPYEEPLITVAEVGMARNGAALGMVCDVGESEELNLEDLAKQAAAGFGVLPRVWGPRERTLHRIATATGSGGSLVPSALTMGCDALVAGEVRYHDALAAVEAGLTVVELGHDVTEWPLVGLLEQVVRGIPGIEPDRISVMERGPRWWTPDN